MRYIVKGFVSGRETAIKRASVDSSTEYIVACMVVVIVVFATYLSLLKTYSQSERRRKYFPPLSFQENSLPFSACFTAW